MDEGQNIFNVDEQRLNLTSCLIIHHKKCRGFFRQFRWTYWTYRTCSWKRYSFFEVFAQRFVIIYIWFLFDFKGLISCNCLDVFIFLEIIWTTSSKALKIMWNVWTIDKEYWSIILNMLWVVGKKNNCEILLKSSKKSLTLYP